VGLYTVLPDLMLPVKVLDIILNISSWWQSSSIFI